MKGFVISWFYPPINSSEGLVTYKLLNRSGLAHDVFTQKQSKTWSYGSKENDLINPRIKTIFGNGESFEEWTDECVRYFEENRNKYDFIMSRSMPPETHAAALAIKRKYPEVKWVASFGDPIYNSPYSKIAATGPLLIPAAYRLPHPKYFIFLLKRQAKKQLWMYQSRGDRRDEKKKLAIERNTLQYADFLIFNNKYQEEFMLKQHNLPRTLNSIVLPHSYEASFYEQKKISKPTKTVFLSHIGHLDRIRSPLNILKAVNRIKEVRPELYAKLSLNFYGILDSISKVYIVDENLHDSVHVHKPVTYFESLDIMQRSNWCLLVDANISSQCETNIYFAAKLADYLGSGSPIFAMTMTDGASADIIRQTGNVMSSHSVDEVYMWLVLVLEGRLKTESKNTDMFDAKQVAKDYDSLILSLFPKPD